MVFFSIYKHLNIIFISDKILLKMVFIKFQENVIYDLSLLLKLLLLL